jgi:NAD(P)-dependent dehydrogenase (short-subunit alcohol dehydrogenase family)
MTATTGKSALIIGASRGLGYALAAEYLLFVNAGVANGPEETVADVSTETFVRLMVTNALSPMRVVEALQDLVAPDGAIEVMSSGQGSVANNDKGGFEIYRASKSALNQPLTIGQSIPGVVDTIQAQAGKGGLQYLDYRGQTVRW